jgi:RNA polymerase sigma-70 factor (ECF subfamily)
MKPDSTETCRLLQQVRVGNPRALELLLARHRPGLRDFVELRLDPRLAARVDPSDIVQETQMEAVRRLPDYLERQPMPFHLWLCRTAYERLLNLRRDHRDTARRSVSREVPWPDRSSLLLARPLLAGGPSPSQHLEAKEFAERLGRAIAGLSEADREILLMRHAEGLAWDEVSCLLGIESAAARKRYGRALLRLRQVLKDHGLLESSS